MLKWKNTMTKIIFSIFIDEKTFKEAALFFNYNVLPFNWPVKLLQCYHHRASPCMFFLIQHI